MLMAVQLFSATAAPVCIAPPCSASINATVAAWHSFRQGHSKIRIEYFRNKDFFVTKTNGDLPMLQQATHSIALQK